MCELLTGAFACMLRRPVGADLAPVGAMLPALLSRLAEGIEAEHATGRPLDAPGPRAMLDLAAQLTTGAPQDLQPYLRQVGGGTTARGAAEPCSRPREPWARPLHVRIPAVRRSGPCLPAARAPPAEPPDRCWRLLAPQVDPLPAGIPALEQPAALVEAARQDVTAAEQLAQASLMWMQGAVPQCHRLAPSDLPGGCYRACPFGPFLPAWPKTDTSARPLFPTHPPTRTTHQPTC